MLFSLLKNVGVNTGSFFAISVVGLLLVPITIDAYGLAGFGLIIMAKLFLPTAILAMFDFGVGEYATQAVAAARANSGRGHCGGKLAIAASTALVSGVIVGAALFFVSSHLLQWLSVPSGDLAAFSTVIKMTAFVLPILFLSLVFEGVIKGFENFSGLRICEVIVSLAYAVMVLGIISRDWRFDAVCYALLASLLLRTFIAFGIAWWSLRNWSTQFFYWDGVDFKDFILRAQLMFSNKTLGAAQSQAVPVLIAIILGVTAVGTFDALTRLPRFAKSVLGLLNSTVLPLAARLESETDLKNMRRMVQTGTLIVGLLALPPLASAMVFSKPILEIWLGGALTHYWHWQAATFLIPALTSLVGFGAIALIVRPKVTSAMNRLVLIQILLQFGLSLALVDVLQERAFILGQVVAMVITFIWQMRLIAVELNTSISTYWRLARIVMVCVGLVPLGMFIMRWIEGPVTLGMAMVVWTLAVWSFCLFGVLDREQRALLRSHIVTKFLHSRSKR